MACENHITSHLAWSKKSPRRDSSMCCNLDLAIVSSHIHPSQKIISIIVNSRWFLVYPTISPMNLSETSPWNVPLHNASNIFGLRSQDRRQPQAPNPPTQGQLLYTEAGNPTHGDPVPFFGFKPIKIIPSGKLTDCELDTFSIFANGKSAISMGHCTPL